LAIFILFVFVFQAGGGRQAVLLRSEQFSSAVQAAGPFDREKRSGGIQTSVPLMWRDKNPKVPAAQPIVCDIVVTNLDYLPGRICVTQTLQNTLCHGENSHSSQ